MTPIEQAIEALENAKQLLNQKMFIVRKADIERIDAALAALRSEEAAPAHPVALDPLKDPLWSEIRADIEKAAKDWATRPNGGTMDEDLYFQFIRVMAYVIESTNILHKSPRAHPAPVSGESKDMEAMAREWWRKQHMAYQYSPKRESILPSNDFQMEADLAAFAKYVLEARPSAGEEGEQWIPVSERLPAQYVAVLTIIPEEDDHVSVAYLERDGSWTMVDHAEKAEHSITHWQPLPSPPKK